jgi:hypothetical protein
MNNMIMALDHGHNGALMMLDLFAVFHTVDPPILKDAAIVQDSWKCF